MNRIIEHVGKIFFLVSLFVSCLAIAQNASKQEVSKTPQIDRKALAEKHKKISELHLKMAECLESNKNITECHEQMASSCKSMDMGKGMGMGLGKGMNHEQMMSCPFHK